MRDGAFTAVVWERRAFLTTVPFDAHVLTTCRPFDDIAATRYCAAADYVITFCG